MVMVALSAGLIDLSTMLLFLLTDSGSALINTVHGFEAFSQTTVMIRQASSGVIVSLIFVFKE